MRTVFPNQGRGIEPGHAVPAHVHDEDHTAIFMSGKWAVRRQQKKLFGIRVEWSNEFTQTEVKVPGELFVPAGQWHEFVNIGDDLAFMCCVFK